MYMSLSVPAETWIRVYHSGFLCSYDIYKTYIRPKAEGREVGQLLQLHVTCSDALMTCLSSHL